MAGAERHQVWIYLTAILTGLGLGSLAPEVGSSLEVLVWPTLGLLLYVTFTQVRLTRVAEAVRDVRFIATVLLGNFVVVPIVVWALLPLTPDDPAVRVGVMLVLLVPCTDWFLTFTHLSGGDTHRAIAVTPLNLLAQLALLPLYLWLFLGETFTQVFTTGRVAIVFASLILLPLGAAWATQRRVGRRPRGSELLDRLGRLPVPLLALVVLLIAASQVPIVAASLGLLPRLLVVYLAYLVIAAVLGRIGAALAGLPSRATRALMFTLGTRNSFVVLPFALALPHPFEAAVVVIVFQSLVELFGMVGYLWVVPRVTPLDASRR